jgi:hypothetical protein
MIPDKDILPIDENCIYHYRLYSPEPGRAILHIVRPVTKMFGSFEAHWVESLCEKVDTINHHLTLIPDSMRQEMLWHFHICKLCAKAFDKLQLEKGDPGWQ